MIDLGMACRENFKEALSALLKYQEENEEDGIDFDSGCEPWILIDSGYYDRMCIDVKCSSARAVGDKIEVFVENDSTSNIIYDQWYNVNAACGLTEDNVYWAIVNQIKRNNG